MLCFIFVLSLSFLQTVLKAFQLVKGLLLLMILLVVVLDGLFIGNSFLPALVVLDACWLAALSMIKYLLVPARSSFFI